MLSTYYAIYILIILNLIFVFRLLKKTNIEYWTGILFMLSALPLIYLLIKGIELKKTPIYLIQVSLMLLFILAELALDYIFKFNFRETKWMLVTYVTLFYAASGGMIGLSSQIGKSWLTICAIILFLSLVSLSFYAKIKTGI